MHAQKNYYTYYWLFIVVWRRTYDAFWLVQSVPRHLIPGNTSSYQRVLLSLHVESHRLLETSGIVSIGRWRQSRLVVDWMVYLEAKRERGRNTRTDGQTTRKTFAATSSLYCQSGGRIGTRAAVMYEWVNLCRHHWSTISPRVDSGTAVAPVAVASSARYRRTYTYTGTDGRTHDTIWGHRHWDLSAVATNQRVLMSSHLFFLQVSVNY